MTVGRGKGGYPSKRTRNKKTIGHLSKEISRIEGSGRRKLCVSQVKKEIRHRQPPWVCLGTPLRARRARERPRRMARSGLFVDPGSGDWGRETGVGRLGLGVEQGGCRKSKIHRTRKKSLQSPKGSGCKSSLCATFDGVPGLMLSVIGPQASRHGI